MITRLGIVLAVSCAFVTAPASAEGARPPVEQFTVGHGIPATAPDGEVPVSVLGLSHAPNGVAIASVLTNMDNVAIVEFRDGAWQFQDFVAAVTKSPWHSFAVEMTGKVYTDNGVPEGTPLLASALTADGGHYSATAAGVWDDTASPSVLIHPLDQPVLAMAAGANGALAFSTPDALYLRTDAQSGFARLEPHDAEHSWQPQRASAMAFDADGRLWVGSDDGLALWDGESWTLHRSGEYAPAGRYTAIAADDAGTVWLGTEHGLTRVDHGRWDPFDGGACYPGIRVNAIAVDAMNAAWVATDAGIVRIASNADPTRDCTPHTSATPANARVSCCGTGEPVR